MINPRIVKTVTGKNLYGFVVSIEEYAENDYPVHIAKTIKDNNGKSVDFREWRMYNSDGTRSVCTMYGEEKTEKTYDKEGRLVLMTDSNGLYETINYHEDGGRIKKIHEGKDENGGPFYECEYDKRGRIIYYHKWSNHEEEGTKVWTEYDDNDNVIHYKNNEGFEFWKEFEGDNPFEVHYKDIKGEEYWVEYNDKWEVTSYKDALGRNIKTKYDKKGRLLVDCKDIMTSGIVYTYNYKDVE